MYGINPCPMCGNDKIVIRHTIIRDYYYLRKAKFTPRCTKCNFKGKSLTYVYRTSWIIDPPPYYSDYPNREFCEMETMLLWNKRTNP